MSPLLSITTSSDLPEGRTSVFSYRDPAGGLMTEAFVIRTGGIVHAYKNQCRHQPLTLDYGDGDFLTDDGQYLLCRNHGALFERDTGRCVTGPCLNAHLHRLEVVEAEGQILVRIPEPDELPELE